MKTALVSAVNIKEVISPTLSVLASNWYLQQGSPVRNISRRLIYHVLLNANDLQVNDAVVFAYENSLRGGATTIGA